MDGQKLLINIIENFTNKAHSTRKSNIKTVIESYHCIQDPRLKDVIDKAIECHKKYCVQTCNETYMRQHNTFVTRYLSKHQPTHRDISIRQNVSLRHVYRDIDAVFDRLMIFIYGIDSIMFKRE